MGGRDGFDEFVAARTQDLHHDAFLLTADQDAAGRLVTLVLAELSRERTDLTQAASAAHLRMARAAARANHPPLDTAGGVPVRFSSLASLSPRQRAMLLFESVDVHDLHSVAQALQLKRQDVEQAYAAIPPELTHADPAELRSLLGDFGELAETPAPATTLAAIRTVHPLRRPRWTYAAAALVIALTVSTVWVTQSWHNDWLRTAAGLNHTHGTRFPAYADGYKLVGIQEVTPGQRESLALGARSALVLQCVDGERDGSEVAQAVTGSDGNYTAQCSAEGRARLMPTTGETLLTVANSGHAERPIGIYRKASWGEYPVATSGFAVETGKELRDVAPTGPDGTPLRPSASGTVLTLRGPAGHPDGTFTGSVSVPAGPRDAVVFVDGLLSPTTTGRFQVTVDGQISPMKCGSLDRVEYLEQFSQSDPWCEIYNTQVPQVPFTAQPYGEVGSSITVRITVGHALGPWTLQIAADRYKWSYREQ